MHAVSVTVVGSILIANKVLSPGDSAAEINMRAPDAESIRVELIDCIAKFVSLVYSINAAILLTRKKLLKHAVASPPLGAISQNIPSALAAGG